MKKFFATVSMLAAAAYFAQASGPALPPDAALEAKVEATLSGMTLEEKIGQMTELTIDALVSRKDDEFFLDPDKLHEAFAVTALSFKIALDFQK